MTTFLFWNLNRKPLTRVVANLARNHDVDVIMLAECSIEVEKLLTVLNAPGEAEYFCSDQPESQIVKVFTRFPGEFMAPIIALVRYTIWHLSIPGLKDILLAIVHVPSKRNWDAASQASYCRRLSEDVREAERFVCCPRTVLVGDLNMNTFKDGVVAANGLHAVMSRRIAEKGNRTIQGESYPFFYNPMWSLLGDASPGPPGTYYYSASRPNELFWHMYDQVLIRSDLLDHFDNASLKILETDGSNSLVSDKGIPDSESASDHLPILFRLRL